MGPGQSHFAPPFFRRDRGGALRRAAPGPGVGTVRARTVGALPRASPGIPGAAAFSAGHGTGNLYAVGAAAGEFRQRVRTPSPRRPITRPGFRFFLMESAFGLSGERDPSQKLREIPQTSRFCEIFTLRKRGAVLEIGAERELHVQPAAL